MPDLNSIACLILLVIVFVPVISASIEMKREIIF